MTLREILTTARSATFEVRNGQAVQSVEPHRRWLDGRELEPTRDNVFTLSGLVPAREHRLEVDCAGERTLHAFRTEAETSRIDVRDCGAVGDGRTDDTQALQSAIAGCNAGGVIDIPAGEWLTAPLFLKSAIRIHIARGARLIGHTDIDRWPVLPGYIKDANGREQIGPGSWEGEPADTHAALITGIGVSDVVIHGEGSIDGNASFKTWWSRPKSPFHGWRPRTVYLVDCANVALAGLTLRNSPSWTVHPLRSKALRFARLRIEAPAESPNTDGINPESCEDVTIAGVHFATGDDCIAIKSGKIAVARRDPRATRRVTISNCLMENGHGAVVIGSEMSCGVYDVHASDCVFRGTDRGLRIKTRRGRGRLGIVEGIRLENVVMERVGTPFVINSFYWCDPDGREPEVGDRRARPVDESTPEIRDIQLRNIDCSDVAHCAGYVLGLPEQPVAGLEIDRYRVRLDPQAPPGFPDMAEGIEAVTRGGFYLCNVRDARLTNITVEGADGPPVVRENVS